MAGRVHGGRALRAGGRRLSRALPGAPGAGRPAPTRRAAEPLVVALGLRRTARLNGFLTWVDADGWLAGGWAGQHVLVLPAASAVVVTTGDPRFRFGPPPSDELPGDWRPALDLVRRHLVAALR